MSYNPYITSLAAIFWLLFSGVNPVNAESHFCITDELNEKLYQANPEIRELESQLNAEAANYQEAAFKSGSDDVYIIPAVIHVLHDDGTENISEEQILDGLQVINEDLRLMNPDTFQIISEFRDLATDTRIEIRLAQNDPAGNPTDGINRVQDSRTFETSFSNISQIQSDHGWDHSRYLNIYLVDYIAGGGSGTILGFAFFPWSSSSSADGIVMRHDRMGRFGTASNDRSRTLTHELGHYLGLYHTFQGGCPEPGDPCHQVNDRVCDTPPAQSPHSGCPLNASTCGELSNVQNHMDYSTCRSMFTRGQAQRMHFFLEGSTRNNLHNEENLISTGVIEPTLSFYVENPVICSGQEIKVSNNTLKSFNDEESTFEWNFHGGNPTVSNEFEPVIVYNEPGIYDLTVNATIGGEVETLTLENYIRVLGNDDFQDIPLYEPFEESLKPDDLWRKPNNSYLLGWLHTNNAGVTHNSSLYLNNFDITGTRNYELILPPLLLNDVENPYLSFDYAFSTLSGSTSDRVRVFVSDDCGNRWVRIDNRMASHFITSDHIQGPFYPSEEEWKNYKLDLTIFQDAVPLLVKIEYDIIDGNGNNFFIDNVIVSGDGLHVSNKPVKEDGFLVKTFPNPFSEMINITVRNAEGPVSLRINDLAGRNLYSGNLSGEFSKSYSPETLNIQAPGVYLLEIQSGEYRETHKIIQNQ